jgi:aryl-alcohol dehydrogenase-like predicted oxidoreductase
LKFRNIIGTDLRSSLIGYGTWGLAGNVYGKISLKESNYLLDYAIDKNINFFDTSTLYGDGYVEEILGKKFKEMNNVIIATKIGMIKNNKNVFIPKFDFGLKNLESHLNKSLKRLKRDRIDIMQLHSPTFNFIKSKKFITVIDFLKKKQKSGKIRYYAISVQSPIEAKYILENFNGFKIIQLNLSLLDMRAYDLDLFKLAEKKNISLVTRTPLAMGFLSGKKKVIKKNYDHRRRFKSEIINKWNAASLKFKNQFKSQITLPELAIKFSCYENSVCSTISGMMSKKEIDINTNAVKNNFSIGRNLKKIKNIYSEFFS